jgi:hypothetical protein
VLEKLDFVMKGGAIYKNTLTADSPNAFE